MAPTLFDEEPKPGDLIEIMRGSYQHWAVYIGHDEVVHMIPPGDGAGSLGDLLSLLDSGSAVVRRQTIGEVAGSSGFRVNNLLDESCRPRDPHDIVSDARKMVGRMLPYSLTATNCEHFVTELRYGRSESRQVKDANDVLLAGALAVAGVALGAALLGALFGDDNSNDRRHRK